MKTRFISMLFFIKSSNFLDKFKKKNKDLILKKTKVSINRTDSSDARLVSKLALSASYLDFFD